MRLFYYGKDGGADSTVSGFWLIEIKSLFSIALLRFGNGSRDAFHSHAFNAWSWVIKGQLEEEFIGGLGHLILPSWKPVYTSRNTFHRVRSVGTTWVLTFRGPWARTWDEYLPASNRFRTLTHGRKEIA
jgi:hypothetical protein